VFQWLLSPASIERDLVLSSTYATTPNSPNLGVEVYVVPSNPDIVSTLREILRTLKLSTETISWIHPTYEKDFRQASII
jgi:hypothetical protein